MYAESYPLEKIQNMYCPIYDLDESLRDSSTVCVQSKQLIENTVNTCLFYFFTEI